MGSKKGFSYEIEYTKAAEKFFVKHENIREKYEDSIKVFLTGDNPQKVDIKRIKAKRSEYYRIRLGEYRVVFAIINKIIVVVTTLAAGSRGDIYKKMDGIK